MLCKIGVDMENITVMVLSTQRNSFYINITNKQVNYAQLWLDVSRKRFMKFDGYLADVQKNKLTEVLKEKAYAKYFDTLESFLQYCK